MAAALGRRHDGEHGQLLGRLGQVSRTRPVSGGQGDHQVESGIADLPAQQFPDQAGPGFRRAAAVGHRAAQSGLCVQQRDDGEKLIAKSPGGGR